MDKIVYSAVPFEVRLGEKDINNIDDANLEGGQLHK